MTVTASPSGTIDRIAELLGDEATSLLEHTCTGITRDQLHLPGPDHLDRVWGISNRKPSVLVNLGRILNHGRLGGTGYVSILPVDQGIEHSAAASFAPNPALFDPENIIELAIEGGCNGVASTMGVLGTMSRKYAHRIPFIVKINHNEIADLPHALSAGAVRQRRAGLGPGRRGRRRDGLLRRRELGRDAGRDRRVLRPGARAGDGDDPLVLSAPAGLQEGRRRLSRGGRPDGPGQPPGRHHRGRHRQAEAGDQQQRLRRRSASARRTRWSTTS